MSDTAKTLSELLNEIHVSGSYESANLSQEIARNVQDFRGAQITNAVVGANLRDITQIINAQSSPQRRELLEAVEREAQALIALLPVDQREEAAENLELLVKGADEKKPNRRWYSVSAEGLLEASKFVEGVTGNLAATIGKLGKLIWPDYPPTKAG